MAALLAGLGDRLADRCSIAPAERAHRVPIVPFGAGSSLDGHVCALAGGACVELSRMNAILSVSAEDPDAMFNPGKVLPA